MQVSSHYKNIIRTEWVFFVRIACTSDESDFCLVSKCSQVTQKDCGLRVS